MLTSQNTEYCLNGIIPSQVVRVEQDTEIQKLVSDCSGTGKSLVVWGGGTHQHLGNVLQRYDVALDLREWAGVIDHQPGDLTVTVRTGTTIAQLQSFLANVGQYLPVDAEDPEQATVGGILSAGIGGPLRAGYGTTRDYLLWTEAVSANGLMVHGGARVVKNVAGYDLTKLYLGSLGSLGVLTQACFKLLPLPPSRPVVLAGWEEPGAAFDALAGLCSGRLAPSIVTMVRGPAQWGEPYNLAPWTLVIGADGPLATTSWQVERFYRLLGGAPTIVTSLQDEAAIAVRQQLMSPRSLGEVRLDVRVLPGQVSLLLEALNFLPEGPPTGVFADVSNGIVCCNWQDASTAWRAVANLTQDLGGRWTLAACPDIWKRDGVDVWGPERGDRKLMRKLKHAFDPLGVFAPGRFAGG